MLALSNNSSIWQQVKSKKITTEEAINILVNEKKMVDLNQLDAEVSDRFFKTFSNPKELPPIIPLLLWQNCYYLACPITIKKEQIDTIKNRTGTDIKIIPILKSSYNTWYHTQNINLKQINSQVLINPIQDDDSADNLTEITSFCLSKATDQIERVKAIISGALRYGASDIHLEPTPPGLKIRYRVDGVLRNITTLPLEISRKIVVAIKVMSDIDISESRRPQDGRIGEKYALESSEIGIDMRVSTLPCVGGEKVVIRLLPQKNSFTDMEKLGFSPRSLPIYKNWLKQPQGMIILTGPTGSGKTSTLYTSLQSVATDYVNVVTVEDPVEYVLPEITQTQVNEAAGMTFAAGLRAILRQDPDIIMLGEIRDHETAETAIRAALTGHLVLTTLHTNDAIGAIPRLKDLGLDPTLISDALLGIVAQRLGRKVCPHCTESYKPNAEELHKLGLGKTAHNTSKFKKGKGCAKCFYSGYLGREAIVETLNVNEKIKELIYKGTTADFNHSLREGNNKSFISFKEASQQKVMTGVTTIEEVLRVLPYNVFSM